MAQEDSSTTSNSVCIANTQIHPVATAISSNYTNLSIVHSNNSESKVIPDTVILWGGIFTMS